MHRHYLVSRIEGLPPKKDGATSLWNKHSEVDRLVGLRRSAAAALNGDLPLHKNVHLRLSIHVPEHSLLRCGDLDNFVSGVCDGLMAANSRTTLQKFWDQPSVSDICPHLAVAIADDSSILSIQAAKIADSEEHWYEIELIGE